MFSSALIGSFTVPLISNKETWGEKYIFKYFHLQLYRVIILYIKHRHQGAVINTRGIETAFERISRSRYSFTFKRRDAQTLFILWSNSTYHTFHKIRRLSVVLRICKSFAIILISHYSVYVLHCIQAGSGNPTAQNTHIKHFSYRKLQTGLSPSIHSQNTFY